MKQIITNEQKLELMKIASIEELQNYLNKELKHLNITDLFLNKLIYFKSID